jgi:hypothetical protein
MVVFTAVMLLAVSAVADPSALYLAISNNSIGDVGDILERDSALANSKSRAKITLFAYGGV